MKSELVKLEEVKNRQKNLDHAWGIGEGLLNNKPALMILAVVLVEYLKTVQVGGYEVSSGWEKTWLNRFLPFLPPLKYTPGYTGVDTLIGPTQGLLLEAGIIMWGMGVTPKDLIDTLKGVGGLFPRFGLETPGLLSS